jgi:hypothetical protein
VSERHDKGTTKQEGAGKTDDARLRDLVALLARSVAAEVVRRDKENVE